MAFLNQSSQNAPLRAGGEELSLNVLELRVERQDEVPNLQELARDRDRVQNIGGGDIGAGAGAGGGVGVGGFNDIPVPRSRSISPASVNSMRRVRRGRGSPRPLWLWMVALLDMTLAIALFIWTTHNAREAADMDPITGEQGLSFTAIFMYAMQGIQFFIGVLLIIALVVPSEQCLHFSVRHYMHCSYLLSFGGIAYVIFALIAVLGRFAEDETWGRMLVNVFNVILRLPVTIHVRRLVQSIERNLAGNQGRRGEQESHHDNRFDWRRRNVRRTNRQQQQYLQENYGLRMVEMGS